MAAAWYTSNVPLTAEEKPIIVPEFRREQCVTALFGCVMLLVTIASITVCALTNEAHRGFDPVSDTALITACIAGMLSFLSPIVFIALRCEGSSRSEYQQLLEDDPRLAYRMNVARVLVAENALRLRMNAWKWFPWADLALPLPLYICIIFIPGARKVVAIIGAGMFLTSLAARILSSIVQRFRIRNASAGDVCFMHFPTKQEVAVLYAGSFTVMKCARDQGVQPARCLLGRSQLVGYHQDPADEASPVVSWSLKMIYGQRDKDNSLWQTITTTFPVDVTKVNDFREWLSAEPCNRMFAFSGATATRNHEISAKNMTFPAFLRTAHLEAEDDFQLGQHNFILTAHITETQDRLAIFFTSIAGEEMVRLHIHTSETIADLCHTVAVHPRFVSSSVRIVLADGRVLNNMNGMASVATLLENY